MDHDHNRKRNRSQVTQVECVCGSVHLVPYNDDNNNPNPNTNMIQFDQQNANLVNWNADDNNTTMTGSGSGSGSAPQYIINGVNMLNSPPEQDQHFDIVGMPYTCYLCDMCQPDASFSMQHWPIMTPPPPPPHLSLPTTTTAPVLSNSPIPPPPAYPPPPSPSPPPPPPPFSPPPGLQTYHWDNGNQYRSSDVFMGSPITETFAELSSWSFGHGSTVAGVGATSCYGHAHSGFEQRQQQQALNESNVGEISVYTGAGTDTDSGVGTGLGTGDTAASGSRPPADVNVFPFFTQMIMSPRRPSYSPITVDTSDDNNNNNNETNQAYHEDFEVSEAARTLLLMSRGGESANVVPIEYCDVEAAHTLVAMSHDQLTDVGRHDIQVIDAARYLVMIIRHAHDAEHHPTFDSDETDVIDSDGTSVVDSDETFVADSDETFVVDSDETESISDLEL